MELERGIPSCHPDKPYHGGLCHNCYSRKRYAEGYRPNRSNRRKPRARCHSDRPHHAKGLCHPCYVGARNGAGLGRMAECHPDRPHRAKGLCNRCYKQQNPPSIEKRRAYYKSWANRIPYQRAKALEKYGLSIVEYDGMLAAQDGVCAICKTPQATKPLFVDHSHTTGRVRALLCNRCNLFVGYMERYESLIEPTRLYLRHHGEN